ncbi:MAG TPA: cytochrome P450 [Acidimicrobiia bacterium]|nr:cytochrome P450 [Acidimicrobiia bacterium]
MTKAEPDISAEYQRLDFVTAQPYPVWERARAECPVFESHGSSATTFTDRPQYHVTRWDDVEQVLRDGQTFSSSINAEHIGQYMGELILAMDGKEHRAYRNLVAHAFRASQLEKWDDTLVRPAIDRLLDEIAPAGRGDLVRDVTSRYPVQVICGIVGVPLKDSAQFHQWAEQINTGPLHPDVGMAASRAMRAYLEPIVEARRVEPAGDLISDLVHAEIDGERLTDEKIYGFLRLLLPAGAETTFRVMGNALTALLTHPAVMQRVVADRSLLPAVIEETLRWETSVTQVSRVATVDTEIGGCPVPAGAGISVITGSANRDAARYDHPDEFDIDRPMQNHMTFGTGQHQCLGMHLARLELRVGLETILARLPNLRLDPEAPPPVIEGLAFRGPTALPVLFDAS